MHARVSGGASALLGKYIVSCSQSAFSGKQRGATLSQWTLLQTLVFGEYVFSRYKIQRRLSQSRKSCLVFGQNLEFLVLIF